MKPLLYTIAILGLLASFALMGYWVYSEVTESVVIYDAWSN